ncbi:oligosaccharide flippase family protein [Moraxellaceae bacterium AER2_44_116]|nr:oligosaccharide flippase family protein [Moraxellaceae bacterium AER2_44_116]
MRIGLQALLFFVLARGLGLQNFGIYTTVFACAQILYPISGLGTHNTMIMHVARYPKLLNNYLGTPLLMTVIFGSFLSIIATFALSSLYKQVSALFILLMFLTEILAFRLLDVSTHAWQALENMRYYALSYTLLSGLRLLLAGGLWLTGYLNLVVWIPCNFVLTLLVALLLLVQLFYYCQLEWRKLYFFRSELKTSLYFSLSGVGQSLYANVDKILIARLLGSEVVGIYAVAQRIVQMAFLPILALFQASYAKYFQKGRFGIQGTLNYSKKLAPFLFLYASVMILIIYLLSPYLTVVFGSQYEGAIYVLKWLVLLLVIQVAHYLLGEAMTGCGYQRIRSILQMIVGLLSVAIIYSAVSAQGIMGAVVAALIIEILLFLVYLVVVIFELRRENIS